jgi:hypothetical protein
MVGAFVHQSWAAIACPVTLVEGKADRDGVVLSFRNTGKLPIQELEFEVLWPGRCEKIDLVKFRLSRNVCRSPGSRSQGILARFFSRSKLLHVSKSIFSHLPDGTDTFAISL